MWETACAEVWAQKSTVFSVRVCVSHSSEGVCGEAELWEVRRITSPALGFRTEPVDCGLEGKEVLPESKGWESF